MKVAILLTGFLRSYKDRFYSLNKNILQKYPCDLYCITWDKQENNQQINYKELLTLYSKSKIIIENSKEYRNLNGYLIENKRKNDVFKTNEWAKMHGFYWANRLRDQWWLVKRGFEEIENNYDFVVSLRS